MLTISKPLSAGQAQTYHAKEFTAPEQNYWKQGDEIKGEWHGKLAAEYGLHDAVLAEGFQRGSQGKHPEKRASRFRHRKVQEYQSESGKTIPPGKRSGELGCDVLRSEFVSLTALVGGDDRVRQAHRGAVDKALDELERYTQSCNRGKPRCPTTVRLLPRNSSTTPHGPLMAMQRLSLHTHAVIFNLTQLDDGSTRALGPRTLLKSQQLVTVVSGLQLRCTKLCNLGNELESGRSGAPEIKGYSPRVS